MIQEIWRLIKSAIPLIKSKLNQKKINFNDPESWFEEDSGLQGFTVDDIKIKKDLLVVNPISRPGTKGRARKGIEVHWIGGMPRVGQEFKMKNVRGWFMYNYQAYAEDLQKYKDGKLAKKNIRKYYAGTHFGVDADGITQFIKEDEIAYSSGSHNYQPDAVKNLGTPPYYSTISIECAHIDWNGKMTERCYRNLLKLVVHLCVKYGLGADDLYRHDDVGHYYYPIGKPNWQKKTGIQGKGCHRFFVKYPKEWELFKKKVADRLAAIEKKKLREDLNV